MKSLLASHSRSLSMGGGGAKASAVALNVPLGNNLTVDKGIGPVTFARTSGVYVTDYLNVVQYVAAGYPALEGARYDGNIAYDTLVDGTPLHPYVFEKGAKRYLTFDQRAAGVVTVLGKRVWALASDGLAYWYTCTTAGTTAGTPTFPTTGTVTDGGVTWAYGGLYRSPHLVVEPLSVNKCTCYGVPRADAYGSTLATGNATKGKVYEIVTRTSVDWSTVGTLLSGTANTIGAKYVITGTLTFTANDTGKECIGCVGTKAYHDGTTFQNPITNMTLSGDVAAVLSIALDAAAVTAAGYDNIVNAGKVYKLDNSLGSANAYCIFEGTVGNVNVHTISIYGRRVGTPAAYLGNNSGSYDKLFSNSGYTRLVHGPWTPSFNYWKSAVGNVAAGAVVYFILPQLEEQPAATSIMPSVGATATRTAVTATIPTAGNISSSPGFDIYMDHFVKQVSGTQVLRQIGTTTDGLRLIHNGTAYVLNKYVGGTATAVTHNFALVLGQVNKLDARSNADGTFDLFCNGVKATTGNTTTTAALATLAANLYLGTDSAGINGISGGIRNLEVFRGVRPDATVITATSVD